MPKLKVNDLAAIKERIARDTALREGGARVKVTVHLGTCGLAKGARQVLNAVMEALQDSDRRDVMVTTSGCAGRCDQEPMLTVQYPDQEAVQYGKVDESMARRICERHVLAGEIQTQWALAPQQEQ